MAELQDSRYEKEPSVVLTMLLAAASCLVESLVLRTQLCVQILVMLLLVLLTSPLRVIEEVNEIRHRKIPSCI